MKKSLFAKVCSAFLAVVMAASAVVSAGAVAEQTTPSGDKVVRISNPDGKPGEEAIDLLEVNTTPGMTATSFIPQQVRAAGLDIADVLSDIIEGRLAP